jgi:hypothetical protein
MIKILKPLFLTLLMIIPSAVLAADEIDDEEHQNASDGLIDYKRFLLDENGKWSLGIGTVVRNSPFMGEKVSVMPIPIIDYSSKNLYFRGLQGGYHIKKVKNPRIGGFSLDAFLSPRMRPGDSRSKLSLDGGIAVGYQYQMVRLQ